jgi:HK97 family phage major capsid protein
LGAHKVGTLIKVSEELLQDSAFNLEQYITSEFTRRIGRAEEAAFILSEKEIKKQTIKRLQDNDH